MSRTGQSKDKRRENMKEKTKRSEKVFINSITIDF